MTEILFYHLQRSPLEQVLPKLLEKTRDLNKRAVVMAGSAERIKALDALLWSYDPDSWLPHGGAEVGHADRQPIWLTTRDENPNRAVFLFLTDGTDSQAIDGYERCFDLFDGRDDSAVAAARKRWATRRDAGHQLSYYQQTERGNWEKKA